ncbi:MAG: indole-3-glycerol phosphate synthase TrpC [Candidatus Eremiobacteraeota bacterium]|nr:indole-3-glycerol phosphate synthase TrpC [Candidatus Eremiobacteraeota bacterium]
MILDRIVERKRECLAEAKKRVPLGELRDREAPPPRDFAGALSRKGHGLIAEYKKASPSRGTFHNAPDLATQAALYGRYADAMSVLTEEDHFSGSLDDLLTARRLVELPLLRKDFIIDAYQVHEARASGADAVLLIAEALEAGELAGLYSLVRELGMEALVEVHEEVSLEHVLPLSPPMVGINNRNLKDMTITRETTKRIAPLIPEGILIVSESGITSGDHLEELMPYAGAFLIGSAFMAGGDPEACLREFTAILARSSPR